MKLSKLSQLFLVSAIGLTLATFLTACQLVTIDFVFVAASAGNTTSSAGQIYTYAVDSQSGALRTGDPTVPSGGTNPVAMAVGSNYYAAGGVIGQTLAMEGVFSFFLESSFLGLFLYGEKRLGPKALLVGCFSCSSSARGCPAISSLPPMPGCNIRWLIISATAKSCCRVSGGCS